MRNQSTFKKLGFGSLILSLLTYVYVAWDDLNGKYLLAEQDYVQIDGKVVYSAVEEKEVRYDKINYYPVVKYDFFVNGKRYNSDKVHFNYTAHSNLASANKALEKYPINKKIIVFYEKGNPSFSVVEPNNYEKGNEVVVLLCIVWGVGIIALYNWHEKRKRRQSSYS